MRLENNNEIVEYQGQSCHLLAGKTQLLNITSGAQMNTGIQLQIKQCHQWNKTKNSQTVAYHLEVQ